MKSTVAAPEGEGGKDRSRAARAVIDRLLQMRQLWEDAANSYFDPGRFQLSVQSCITTARTVTFILQSNKKALANFDVWYEPYRKRCADDPVMVWARDTRNSVEKQGDLATHSQVHVELVASYLDGPQSEWVPANLFTTTTEIWRAVPAELRTPHTIENGTLIVERRWVANNYPEVELLEAIARVYSVLADIVTDFVKALDLPIPGVIEVSRPDSMAQLAMDRATYVSMKDGSIIGVRLEKAGGPPVKEKHLLKRYGRKGTHSIHDLKNAKTFLEICEAYFRTARIVLRNDGYHRSFALLLKGSAVFRVVGTDHPDRASRYLMVRELARYATAEGADGVIMINESWIANVKDAPKSGFAVDAKNRGEALTLVAANAQGDEINIMAPFHRKKNKTHKIKLIEPNKVSVGTPHFILIPFLKEWGRFDITRYEEPSRIAAEAGIEDPWAKA
ncbi:MAG: hypothetical protein E5X80_26170 [Mesorhizobium sp.]|uniref:hypothetical protein n=1 Tax=Mesorhizobium sp. TaxID=1871066 RepID=UPI0012145EFE|nr:hypothetical protein [Mesorhizobium sp.]TIO48890.1 MAG: hypothetical protein E5X78_27955 [Mesorhizobium sp.]TIO62047.1 MAG: hypothetical protein E5X79_05130 [Mesorhizobium sp.]TJV59158.1 MAG: hypothetical protein E5X80_26170 [Mesorhizobium sp.]